MVIHGMMMNSQAATVPQRADRWRLNFTVDGNAAAGQEGTAVTLHNLSVTGALIETAAELSLGQDFIITLPEAGEVVACVVWTSGQLFGCRFHQPLPRSVLSAARLRNPLPAEIDPADGGGAMSVDAAETLGMRLRRLRESRGMSLAGLARLAGLSKPSIWAWEKGATVPRRKSLLALASALEVSEEEIVGGVATVGSRASAQAANPDASNMDALKAEIAAARHRIGQVAGIDAANIRILIEL